MPLADRVGRWTIATGAVALLFVVLRLPILVHAPGGQDEQWFAVPGYTVWTEGIPRIPYCPTEERSTFFEGADRCLFALPPALFYVQAPFHILFEPGYPTGRIPLFLGGLLAIVILMRLMRQLNLSIGTALVVACVFAIGRPLMFTSLMTRPDLLCILFGWLALLSLGWTRNENTTPHYWRVIASGACMGLAALFHPFALVFLIQIIALWLLNPGGALGFDLTLRRRFGSLAITGLICGIVVAFWLPLIASYPNEFRSQFFSNVVDRAGPGLPSRLLWPFPSLAHHAKLVYEFAGPFQSILLITATCIGATFHWKTRRDSPSGLAWFGIILSSIFLTAVVAGLHPTKGYWVYPAFWVLAGCGSAIERLKKRMSSYQFAAISLIAIVLSLPGAGLRTVGLYYTNWGESDYAGRKFIAQVLENMPDEGLFLADLVYVYDVWLSGRETLLLQERQQYWPERDFSGSHLLISWEGDDAEWSKQYNAEFLQRFGDSDPIQRCWVEHWISRPTTTEPKP